MRYLRNGISQQPEIFQAPASRDSVKLNTKYYNVLTNHSSVQIVLTLLTVLTILTVLAVSPVLPVLTLFK